MFQKWMLYKKSHPEHISGLNFCSYHFVHQLVSMTFLWLSSHEQSVNNNGYLPYYVPASLNEMMLVESLAQWDCNLVQSKSSRNCRPGCSYICDNEENPGLSNLPIPACIVKRWVSAPHWLKTGFPQDGLWAWDLWRKKTHEEEPLRHMGLTPWQRRPWAPLPPCCKTQLKRTINNWKYGPQAILHSEAHWFGIVQTPRPWGVPACCLEASLWFCDIVVQMNHEKKSNSKVQGRKCVLTFPTPNHTRS